VPAHGSDGIDENIKLHYLAPLLRRLAPLVVLPDEIRE
jgi:hypothetical protein